MAVPAIIFRVRYRKDWYISGDNGKRGYDYLEYISRPEAFAADDLSDDDSFDYLEYMRNDDKSDGAFDSINDHLDSSQLQAYRELEKQSRSEGCPKYNPVLSFDNNFLRENGAMTGAGHIDTARMKDIARAGINALIDKSEKLQADNCYWVAAIHTNTDNVHVHYSLCEYHRLSERRNDNIELEAIKALKSTVANSLIGATRSKELTALKRQILFPELSAAIGSAESLISELAEKLPDDIPMQYANHRMKPFQNEIDRCVDNIIESNVSLKENFGRYLSSIRSMDKQYDRFYGDNSKSDFYSEHQLEDFYTRAGNMLLKHIKQMSSGQPIKRENKELNERLKACGVSERKENENVFDYLRDNDCYISNYSISLKLKNMILQKEAGQQEECIDILRSVADISDTAAFALGLYYLDKNDTASAKQYLEISADNNDRDAQYRAGKLALQEKDFPAAEKWLRMSADNNNAYAQFAYGMILMQSDHRDEGIHYIQRSQENGNKIAHRVLQNINKQERPESDGKRRKDNFGISDKLTSLTRKAAHGDAQAQYDLGRYYTLEKNYSYDKAIKWLTASADQDNSFAQYSLGKLYLREKKNDKAEEWFRRSAENDNPYGMAAYGLILYREGKPKAAQEQLKAASEKGLSFASDLLRSAQRSRASKPPRVRQAVRQSHYSSSACWNTLNRLLHEYDAHIKKLQAEFDYENNVSNDYDYDDYSYNYF